jgi:DNA-directed RNA polymerase specialized sigma24 family protein
LHFPREETSDMPQEATLLNSSIPVEPLPEGAHAFTRRVVGLMDGQPKDEATVVKALEGMDAIFDVIAAELYSLASMLVGEGEDSVRLVETTVTNTEVSVCHDPLVGRKTSRRVLAILALDLLAGRDAGSLTTPSGPASSEPCIDDDDLAAAGISLEELKKMIGGPDRDRVRSWLASLPTVLRAVFVMRAVAGFPSEETAQLLREHGGPQAAGWTSETVRESFRRGLCSLASQLLSSSAR